MESLMSLAILCVIVIAAAIIWFGLDSKLQRKEIADENNKKLDRIIDLLEQIEKER